MLSALVASTILLPPIVPRPVHYERLGSNFQWTDTVSVQGTTFAADYLRELLRKGGGRPVSGGGSSRIRLVLDDDAGYAPEAYTLRIEKSGIVIGAGDDAGLLYGVMSLRQLLPPEIEQGKKIDWANLRTEGMLIKDQPRFGWRGLHLDVSRHFYPTAFIKKYIDLIAKFKMNVFHWHLIDDGGWRIEIRKYPKLTTVGAWREGDGKGWSYTNLKFGEKNSRMSMYGGFYSQKEIKDVVAYAKDRGVTVVPEIEMPGHALPAPWAYPEVGCTPDAISAWKKQTGMFGANVYCAGKERTFSFLNDVLDEVVELFPSQFIHIGGDEVDKFLWNNCAECQARMKTEGLKDAHELQSYFIKRIEKHLNARGKRLIGWDEILEGGLAPNASVMSWRGEAGGVAAAKSGHDVVMSPTSHCYFDYPYTSITTEAVYGYEPIPKELTEEEGRRVLGAQGNLWTEWMDTSRVVEKMAFPRAVALAEVLWSPKEGRSWGEFQTRLRGSLARLDALDVHYEIPVPIAKLDAALFKDKATVSFELPDVPLGQIRYTTDGSVPGPRSKLYKGPFDVTQTTNIRAAVVRGSNASSPIGVSFVKIHPAASGAVRGLTAIAYYGKFSSVAEMRKPDVDRGFAVKVTDFSFKPAAAKGATWEQIFEKDLPFGIGWYGGIVIPKDGIYEFSTSSDDGSVLIIGGAVVVDNDGLHGKVQKTGRVFLPAGRHSFALEFFEAGGAESLEVTVRPPGEGPRPLDVSWFSD